MTTGIQKEKAVFFGAQSIMWFEMYCKALPGTIHSNCLAKNCVDRLSLALHAACSEKK
jgi:hypothetical protein